jgi:hypothetical protein
MKMKHTYLVRGRNVSLDERHHDITSGLDTDELGHFTPTADARMIDRILHSCSHFRLGRRGDGISLQIMTVMLKTMEY